MQFQTVRDALINTIGADVLLLPVDDQFSVVGYQRQAISAKRALFASIQIYYNTGDLPKSSSAFVGGPVDHNCSFRIDMTVAGRARGDLDSLNNANSPAQKMAALATFQEAAYGVDIRIDQLWSDVWNILMNAKNELYGLPVGALSSRWVGGFSKSDVSDKGEIVTISGSATFTCKVSEDVQGEEGTPGELIDVTLSNINGDVEQKTGVAREIGGS